MGLGNPGSLGRTVAGEPRTRPGPVMAKARRLAHELEERRALVGLVRVRPAEGVLIPPAQGTWEALSSADTGAFPLCRSVCAVTVAGDGAYQKTPTIPPGCDGADKPVHYLFNDSAATEKKALGITASV